MPFRRRPRKVKSALHFMILSGRLISGVFYGHLMGLANGTLNSKLVDSLPNNKEGAESFFTIQKRGCIGGPGDSSN